MTRLTANGRTATTARSAVSNNASTRTNLITNPSFEASGGWSVGSSGTHPNSSTTIPSTDINLFGTSSGKIVQGDGTSGHLYFQKTNIPVTPGATYTASCYVYLTNYTSGSVRIQVNDNGFNGIATGSSISTTNQWIRTSVTFSIPSSGTKDGTNQIQIILDIGTGTPLYTAYYDGVLLEKSSVLDSYFDGSFPNASWTGTVNASTSTLPQPRNTALSRNLA